VTTFFSNATHHCRRATSPVSETQPIDVPLGGWWSRRIRCWRGVQTVDS
jgi:hypothetical protein